MEKSPINKIFLLFENCFKQLQSNISTPEIEHLALLVHYCLAGRTRAFHTPDHIFEVCAPFENPLQVLAGLFHDIIYFQVDRGFPKHTESILQNLIELKEDKIFLQTPLQEDTLTEMCMDIFEMKEGDELLVNKGMNEFLSTYIAFRMLKPYLSVQDLFCVGVCIEATIPFRVNNENGKNYFDKVFEKLALINQQYNLELSSDDLENILERAVEIANQDVLNFSDIDAARFLDNTWMLILEANFELSVAKNFGYTIVEYRESMQKTEAFLNFLNPASIFHQYKQTPDDDTFQVITRQAHRNVEIARLYLATKLLNVAILEALAKCTGGDVPMSMFTGGVRSELRPNLERAEDFLPQKELSDDLDYDETVYHLLEYGRSGKSNFDMNHSPLSAFLYKSLGSQQVVQMLNEAKKFFTQTISPREFLMLLDRDLVNTMAKACAQVAVSRKILLEEFFN